MKQFLYHKHVENKADGEYSGLLLKFRKSIQRQAAIQKEFIKKLDAKCSMLQERRSQIEKLVVRMTNG